MTIDTYLDSNYSSVLGTAPSAGLSAGEGVFIFDNFSSGLHDSHYLALGVATDITSPGTYALEPGASNSPGSFSGSGEFVDGNLNLRLVTGGNLIGTAAVPEPSTWAFMLGGAGVLGAFQRFRRS